MSAPDDGGALDTLAAEYVIGTLAGDERTAFSARLATDEAARSAVFAWEQRLASLRLAGDEVTPPVGIWSRIERALTASVEPFSARPSSAPPRLRLVDGGGRISAAAIKQSRDRWRLLAFSMAAIAAALVGFVVVRETGTARLPELNATYVAAVNRGGDKPALIVTVDLRTRQVLVRPVAAQAPAGRSLELWYIGNGRSPRSMGLVSDAAARVPIPTGAEADGMATFAVSVEPPGGSRTGGPTGVVLYSGQLVKE